MKILPARPALATLLTITLVPALATLGLAPPAVAAPPPVSPAVTAATSVDTLAADVLGVALPVPLGSLTAANLDLGDVTGAVNGADPRTEAHAANLGLDAVGVPLDGILSTADQAAPPDNATATDGTTIDSIDVPTLLGAGVSDSTAHARWTADDTCLAAGTDLTTSSTTTADAALLDLPVVGALLSLPGEVTTSQSVSLESSAGGVDGREVVGETRSTLVDASLFGEVGVGVSEAPVLTATASGVPGGASVTYSEPVVTLSHASLPDGEIVLDAANDTAAFVLPENPLLSLEVSLGTLTETVSADGTSATGSTALLHVRLFLTLGAVDVATVDLIPMSADVTAPTGGIECGEVDASTFVTLDSPDGTGTLTDSSVTFSGTREPGASVVVTDASGDVVCTAIASPDGGWSCTGTAEEGTQVYTATATDPAGNTATDTVTLTVDSEVAGGVTILTPADGSTSTDTTPTVSGTTEPGSAVRVTEGEGEICTAEAGPTGAWSCESPTLGLGAHDFTATATDVAGNTATAEVSFTVVAPDPGDTTPPTAPVITAPADGSSTEDTTPTIAGTAEPGSRVTVTEGGTVVCTAVADVAGAWACTPSNALPLGPHMIAATATDVAGNTSPADTATFTLVAAPQPPVTPQPPVVPNPPGNPDRDGDGLTNVDEGKLGTDPDDPDTDNDGLTDGVEVNGMTIKERFEVCGTKARTSIRVVTDPLVKDTDRDGLTDGREVKGYVIKQMVSIARSGDRLVIGRTRSNPTKADTDKDGIKDKVEATGSANKKWQRRKTDSTKCDTDRGGISDGREIKVGSDPTRITSGPNDIESRGRSGS